MKRQEYGSGINIIACIPAYNEEATIAAVVRGTQPFVDEVIVIDDGSDDATAAQADSAGATVAQHDHNRGKAAAIMTAFRHATARHADVLVLLDGDGQHDPVAIPALVHPILEGEADIVVGSRFLDVKSPVPFYRTLGQRALNFATRVGSGVPCSDSQCGFRALNRQAFTSIQLHETFGLAVESEMQFEAGAQHLRLAEVPVYVRYDRPRRRNPVLHGLGVLSRIATLTVENHRKATSPSPTRPQSDKALKASRHVRMHS
jgi:glycosyltransferase involved in cell wall biosynthesis